MQDALISVIRDLKANPKLFLYDEATTKQALVLKVLSILGWNVFDPHEVRPEFSVGATRVDFALLSGGKRKVFIEVKKASEALDAHQEQLLSYSFQEGVPLAILTNGILWWFYLPLFEGNWSERRFYAVDVMQQAEERIAQAFADYLQKQSVVNGDAIRNAETAHRGRLVSRQVRETIPLAWNELLHDQDELLVDLIVEKVEAMCGHRPSAELVQTFLSDHVGQSSPSGAVANGSGKRANPPLAGPPVQPKQTNAGAQATSYQGKTIKGIFFRGQFHPVDTWIDALVTLCEKVHTEHANDFHTIKSLRGKKRLYFSENPSALFKPRRIPGSSLFVMTNQSANSAMNLCAGVLALFNYPPGTFSVKAE